jgi:hypothetical protein
MSTRYNDGSHYENHQRATELQDQPAHAHRSAGNDQLDHETPHEQTRQAQEHSPDASAPAEKDVHGPTGKHGLVTFGHAEIAALAHRLWEERGRPEGTADEDWHQAVAQLRSQNLTAHAGHQE